MTSRHRSTSGPSPRPTVLLAVLLVAGAASAQTVPTVINFQGRLADRGQTPVDGTLDFEFRIYDAATSGSLLWSESWAGVSVTGGVFSVLLGANGTPLPTGVFTTGSDRWLELVVDNEVMSPRQRLGSVGHAHQAERVGSLDVTDIQQLITPPGTIKFFDSPECPAGWTEYLPGRGRTVVGLAPGGVPGATVGASLLAEEDRPHGHSVDPPPVALASSGEHMHGLNPPSVLSTTQPPHAHEFDPSITTSSAAGGHTHSFDPSTTSTTAEGDHTHVRTGHSGGTGGDSHNHQWVTHTDDHRWTTFTVGGNELQLVDWGQGMDTAGSGHYPFSRSTDSMISYHTDLQFHTHGYEVDDLTSSSAGGHDHDLDIGAFDSEANSDHTHDVDLPPAATTGAAAHAHDVDLDPFSTASEIAHAHTVDLSVFASGPAGTSEVVPYIQLTICRKD